MTGSPRSGTTLLSYILNLGERVCALPEIFLATKVASADSLLETERYVRHALGESTPVFYSRFARLVDSMYSDYAKKQGKSRWVSKELFCTSRLDLMDAMFDYRSRFIHIARHGFDVADSCAQRFNGRDGRPPSASTSLNLEVYLDDWISSNTVTLDFAERNRDRCTVIRYEDLVEAPERVSEQLFQFIGEPWDRKLLDKLGSQKLHSMGDNKILKTGGRILKQPSRWRNWPKPLLTIFGRKANPVLERLGYEPISMK